jgi:hypothetical protein
MDNYDSWQSGVLEADNSTLGNPMEVALTWTSNIITREAKFNYWQDAIANVLPYTLSELGDEQRFSTLVSRRFTLHFKDVKRTT